MDQDMPTHAEIAKKAYELWLEEGRPPDSAERNWLAAELELTAAAGLSRLGVTPQEQTTGQRLVRRVHAS